MTKQRNISLAGILLALFIGVFCLSLLSACGGGGGGGGTAVASTTANPNTTGSNAANNNIATNRSNAETSGNAFLLPSSVELSVFNKSAATGQNNALIDISSAPKGYVGASGISNSKLKLRITKDDQSMNYDMPSDGSPIIAPLNMEDGVYTVAVMQETTGSRYVELHSVTVDANIQTEFSPYLVPNIFCNYDEKSAAVTKARELVRTAQNEGDALRLIYEWIENNIAYDKTKATELSGKKGYIPDPDETLKTETGICLDYAALAGAMLRSIGIPCKVVTGYVSPDGVYHAWNMVWIDGQWQNIHFTVNPKDWTRIDLTRAANGNSPTIGDGKVYTDRYVY